MCMSVLYVCCMYVYHTHSWCPQLSEEDIQSFELELQMVMCYHMGAGNRTWVLCVLITFLLLY